jgi:hypothetical protein
MLLFLLLTMLSGQIIPFLYDQSTGFSGYLSALFLFWVALSLFILAI